MLQVLKNVWMLTGWARSWAKSASGTQLGSRQLVQVDQHSDHAVQHDHYSLITADVQWRPGSLTQNWNSTHLVQPYEPAWCIDRIGALWKQNNRIYCAFHFNSKGTSWTMPQSSKTFKLKKHEKSPQGRAVEQQRNQTIESASNAQRPGRTAQGAAARWRSR